MHPLRRTFARTAGRRGVRSVTVAAPAAVIAAVILAATAAGCSKPTATVENPLAPPPGAVRLYGVDGNMLNSVGAMVEDYPDSLRGMKGTAPFTRLPQTFKDRLHAVDSELTDEIYAGESYDAVVISALAAEIAGTNRPRVFATQINGVTTGGTVCESPRACLELIKAGKDIAYKGISLRLGGFTDAGEPSASTYGIFRFAEQNTLASNLTEFVPAGDPTGASHQRPPMAQRDNTSGALRIGTLLPKTGQLASAGPPMFAGARLAVKELNEAGGVLGRPIAYVEEDDGTDPGAATAAAERLISQDVHVIVGAGGSGISKAILPTVVAAGVVLFSPCNTAAELSTIDDEGLYFRTAPPDDLQAKALTDIIMRDGVRRIFMLARDDAYGRPFMEAIEASLLAAGLAAADVKTVLYSIDAPDFATLGSDVKQFAPDGVVVIGYDESADALTSIMKAGLTSRGA